MSQIDRIWAKTTHAKGSENLNSAHQRELRITKLRIKSKKGNPQEDIRKQITLGIDALRENNEELESKWKIHNGHIVSRKIPMAILRQSRFTQRKSIRWAEPKNMAWYF